MDLPEFRAAAQRLEAVQEQIAAAEHQARELKKENQQHHSMSVEDINRFTKDDVVCALEMYNEDYVTFPRDDIAKISGLTMPVNKRNFQKQADHLEIARAIRDIKAKAKQKGKKDWREGNGRPKGSGAA